MQCFNILTLNTLNTLHTPYGPNAPAGCSLRQFSSAIFACATVLVGTSSMPHFGHSPGLSETTSACDAIGQV